MSRMGRIDITQLHRARDFIRDVDSAHQRTFQAVSNLASRNDIMKLSLTEIIGHNLLSHLTPPPKIERSKLYLFSVKNGQFLFRKEG